MHHEQRLVLRNGVQSVGHLNGDKDRQSHGHGLGGLENLAGNSFKVLRRSVALHVVGQLPERHLGSSGVHQEPVGGGTNSSSADISTNDHVSEEEPGSDESLVSSPGRFVHDVEVGRVEAEGGGGKSVSHQVHPKQLDRDQGLGQAKGGC